MDLAWLFGVDVDTKHRPTGTVAFSERHFRRVKAAPFVTVRTLDNKSVANVLQVVGVVDHIYRATGSDVYPLIPERESIGTAAEVSVLPQALSKDDFEVDPDVLVRDVQVFAVALARLLTADVLPFDRSDTVDHHLDIIVEYDAQAGDPLDLTPVCDELTAISDVLDRIDIVDDDPTDYNNELVAATRTLTRLNITSEGRSEQDPATTRTPYPSLEPATDLPDLDGDAFRCQQVAVYRARNRVEHDLRQARCGLETLVRASPDRYLRWALGEHLPAIS